jgi:hypothetical protein
MPARRVHCPAMRRLILLLAACAAVAVPLAGCGSSSRGGGGHRVFNGSVCAFSVWRATHDARTHHFAFAAFQAYLALHHCPRAFGHR